jgi:hypothetical protein
MDFALKSIVRSLFPIFLGVLTLSSTLQAGIGGNLNNRAVGGVIIDASGVMRTATVQELQALTDAMEQGWAPLAGDIAKQANMRMVSLRGIQNAIVKANEQGREIPEDVKFLAGLQRIEYVFVDKEKNDVIIAGPAEPWKLRPDGFVVGTVTGGATMRLADLVVALRTVETARNEGISCSIEPTAEGRLRLRKLLRRITLRPGQNPAVYEASMREAFGPQTIQLTGVPTDSRFARTMVAADYEMKRVAMGLAPSQVDGLNSYLEMSKNSSHASNQNPRWWMACDYDSLGKSEDGLAWKLSGQGVKTMTDIDAINDDGTPLATGNKDKFAQTWADTMTKKYAELSRRMPIFSDLQNIMDMTIVSTLIVQEGLAQKANLDLALFTVKSDDLPLSTYEIPKAVDPQCSFIRGLGGKWVVTASGGVDINGFEIVEKQQIDTTLSKVCSTALAATNDNWWWDR